MSNKTAKIKQIKQKLVPKLRFPEFSKEWKNKRLGDIGEIITGSTPPTNEREHYDGEYLFVSPFDIKDNRYVESTKTTLTKSGFLNGRKVKKGSSLFVCIGSTIGKVAQAKYDCTTNQQINSVIPISNNNDFVFSLLQFHSGRIQRLQTEQAVPILNKTTFSNYVLSIPTPLEQQKIADCLSSVDDLIAAQDQKVDALKKYKKGLMQQLFPREGETTPRLRFPEFQNAGEWEEKSLGDVLDYERPDQYIVTDTNYQKTGIPVLTANKSFILGYTSEEIGIFKDNLPVIIFDDFTVDNKYVDFPFKVKSSAIKILKRKDKNSLKFLFEIINQIKFGASEHKRHYISIYQNLLVRIPEPKEQKKIATHLSSLDELITTQTQKLETLKTHKKGLMQQLFPTVSEVQE